jgi:chromosomal replication initiator protein
VAHDAQQLAERGHGALRALVESAALITFDDVQHLQGRALAQEQLFHLIEHALEHGPQLVLAGTQPPRRLDLEERLRTRLGWGLAVAVEAPHLETRVAALRRLAGEALDAPQAPSPAKLATLVERLAPDFHQVVRLANRLREGGLGDAKTAEAASLDRILQVVSQRHGLRPSDLVGRRRTREVAHARQCALWLARRLTGHSLIALGGMLDGRDHSTVLSAINLIEARRQVDPVFRRELEDLVQEILGQAPG